MLFNGAPFFDPRFYVYSQKSLRLKKRFLRTGINTRPEGACEGRAALGLRNALKQAKEGLFKSQIKDTISHFKLTASQLVRRSLAKAEGSPII